MSAAAPLKSLTISAFRGSSQTLTLTFEAGKKLSLIYGENGTGKTTICDAFEFLAQEELGSLKERGLGQSLYKFWPTAGRPAAEVKVVLQTSGGTCSGRIHRNKAVVSPASQRPRVEILRRQQVLNLIEAPPAKRYEAVKRFVDIEAFETSEAALRTLVTTLGRETADAKTAELQSLAALGSFYDAAGAPAGLNAMSWARQQLATPKDDRRQDVAKLVELRRRYDLLKLLPARLTQIDGRIEAAQSAARQSEAAYAAAVTAVAEEAEETLDVLQAGRAYLHRHADVAACPLCQSPDAVDGLAARIEERLERLKALGAAREDRRRCGEALARARDEKAGLVGGYEQDLQPLRALLDLLVQRPDIPRPPTSLPADIHDLGAWLEGCKDTVEAWASLEGSWSDGKFIDALRRAVDTYDFNQDRLAELKQLVPRAEAALNVCMKARQAFTTGLIAEIAQEVGRLYETVHPGEGLDKVSFPLDPTKRASMDLSVPFEGVDAPPQAYFSRSHLDTLGLCVFLALALREGAAETILILDDVLGSVDEPHVDRVIEMIYEVSHRFRHTVLTTHYRPWREKFRWGRLRTGQCQFIELTAWRLADGMRVTTSMPEVARLKAMLAISDVDTQAVCGKAGVILEAMLDYLTLKYECRVPRRPGATYTLGDLLPAVDKKLREALKVEMRDCTAGLAMGQTLELRPILDELDQIMQARNAFGAHFKEIGFELLDQDALAFARAVERLADALIDPEHGWPSNDRSGSYWRNSGDTRRLHPLRKPS